ncbi:hypothetical protein F0562_015406 [Nyssa sinensis]|uniref:Protein kinase domain-containing protein n=1 Tax=Nyssa sinensis TaxID=561372 RepID=A0A5J4ZKB0_9ASTE|nr:hypothetical protein F0562_015406 [Nyssa sinensis]
MGICFFQFLFLVLYTGLGAGNQDDCKVTWCSGSPDHGPAIHFPFRLKGQPDHCGCPGFNLSCTQSNDTVLELPLSVKALVREIDYKSRMIHIDDLDGRCLVRQYPNLSASPLKLHHKYTYNYTLFNCSSAVTRIIDLTGPIACLDVPGNDTYAAFSDQSIFDVNLYSCRKMFNIFSVGHGTFNSGLQLYWSKPMCINPESKGNKHHIAGALEKLKVAGEILCLPLLLLVVIALYHVHKSNKLKKEDEVRIEQFLGDYKALKPTRYSYADIKKITNQFTEKLGQGGYGTVFKGKLSDEIYVAIKILDNSNLKGNGEEFINEVGTIGRIHHVNVVRLVGYCADGFRRALVYEFLPNDSLEKFISSGNHKKHSLGWEELEDIALGIAKGIEYLHQGCDKRILHFDIKPHNILLDHKLNPKIADFGLAKLCSKEQSAVSMTTARGTMGYIAPEVFSRNFGNVSYKSDVYSFGMLLLEMVRGKKNIDIRAQNTSQAYFPEWVYNRLNQGEELGIQIDEEDDTKIAKKLTIVGLWCIQWYPIDRPSMNIVVQMLEGNGETLTMPPNPFASTNPVKTNATKHGKGLNIELEVISELEGER